MNIKNCKEFFVSCICPSIVFATIFLLINLRFGGLCKNVIRQHQKIFLSDFLQLTFSFTLIFLVTYYYTDRIRLTSEDFEFSLSILYMDFSILSRILIDFFLYFCLPFCTYYSFSICWFFKIGFLYMLY